ncbi:hypothetical protein ACMYML_23525, partial [Salmonella enterica subsp. enterica serovar Enteritidis]
EDVVSKFMVADVYVFTSDPDNLRKYLREHKSFSHLIKAIAASGGGASVNKGGGAAPEFKDMSESDRLELYKSNPSEFERQLIALRK